MIKRLKMCVMVVVTVLLLLVPSMLISLAAYMLFGKDMLPDFVEFIWNRLEKMGN